MKDIVNPKKKRRQNPLFLLPWRLKVRYIKCSTRCQVLSSRVIEVSGSLWCFSLLYYALLYCTLLYIALLCCTMLWTTVICCSLLCSTVLCFGLLCCTLFCSAVLYFSLIYSALPCCTLIFFCFTLLCSVATGVTSSAL